MTAVETLEDRAMMFQADAKVAPHPVVSSVTGDDDGGEITDQVQADSQEKLFSFHLRGNSLNPILDASHPLLALALNLTMADRPPADVINLRRRLLNEIQSIELEMHRLNYDRFTVMAHQYCLCALLDEFIMTSKWGTGSEWSSQSLLSTFHEETWAGDRFFMMLDRMLVEPKRYLHLVEFQYVCLCLGYEGKYGTYAGDHRLLESIIKETHDVIRKTKGQPAPLSFANLENVVEVPHAIKWGTPIPVIIGAAIIAAGLIYTAFFLSLDRHIDRTLIEINEILRKER